MKNKNIALTIKLIQKCKNQPIILQILISHLQFLLMNTNEMDLSNYSTDTATLLLSSCIKTKKRNRNIEKTIMQYLVENRKKYCSLKLRIILIYLNNQCIEHTNFLVLTELLHNYIFKNALNDFLIFKYLTRMLNGKYFDLSIKNRIQDDIFKSLLLQIKVKNIPTPVWSTILPAFIATGIDPPVLHSIKSDHFVHKALESIYMYCMYEKDECKVKAFLDSKAGLKEHLGSYLAKKEICHEQKVTNSNVCYVFIDSYSIFDDIKYRYEEAADKKRFLDGLTKLCDRLKECQ